MFLDRVLSITFCLTVACLTATTAFSQVGNRGRNNPYSANPSPRVKSNTAAEVTKPDTRIDEVPLTAQVRPAIVQAAFVSNKASGNSRPPTEIYRIGTGDVLAINLKNAGNASGYYTVRPNGTIDFPLAGNDVAVAGETIDEAVEIVAAGITLYKDPQVAIKIREYASHKITVAGLVERPGERSIQREAVPLYVVRAEAGALSNATMALIRRSDVGKIETFDLHSPDIDLVLVYPENFIEFTDGRKSVGASSGFYYIAGAVNSTGQREFTVGLTLFQAVTASGGAKGNPKKATVRRKDEKGALRLVEYNLRAIKEGKATDPALFSGDMIEIGN
jgi:polysaccharide export outer membrane protein